MSSENVLIVEPELKTKEFILNTLKKEEYNVFCMHDLEDILGFLQKKYIDIMIIDLSYFDKASSIDLIKRSRLIKPGLAIVAIHDGTNKELILKAFQNGAHNILCKPISKPELIRVLNEVLENTRLAKENIRLKTLLPLFELTQSLISELDINKIFDHLVKLVCLETRSDTVSILLYEEREQKLYIKAALGLNKELIGTFIEKAESNIIWTVIKTGKPLLNNINTHQKTKTPCPVATLCVPLSIKGRIIGAINCQKYHLRNGFTESDLELLSILAGQASIAIENARLFNNVRNQQDRLESSLLKVLTAQEDERARISAELHDGLAQWLVSASYGIQLGEAQLSQLKINEAREELNRANEIINNSIKELRRLILDLHPIALAELGVVEAIRQNIESFNRENGVRCNYMVMGNINNLSFINGVTLYRVTCEALNNIRKHAHARFANVAIQISTEAITAEISDDGIGFDYEKIASMKGFNGNLGLITMKERTEMIGGSFEIFTAPGKGTKIRIKLPISTG